MISREVLGGPRVCDESQAGQEDVRLRCGRARRHRRPEEGEDL